MSIARRTPLFLALCLFASNVQANGAASLDKHTVENAQQLALACDKGTEAYAILESLTSEVGPRMAGSAAFDRAIVWAQEKFKALGYDKVYLEPVTFPVWERRRETARRCWRPSRRRWHHHRAGRQRRHRHASRSRRRWSSSRRSKP